MVMVSPEAVIFQIGDNLKSPASLTKFPEPSFGIGNQVISAA